MLRFGYLCRAPVKPTEHTPMRHNAPMPDPSPPSPRARYIVFDLETLHLSHEVRGGWRNIKDFGLAVGVTIDEHGAQRVWEEPDAQDLIDHLAAYPRVVGFNSRRFDLTVLSAYGDVSDLQEQSFDVLLELQAVSGRRKGMRLQDIADATFGEAKSLSDGVEAVHLWRTGQPEDRRRVIDYCARDVELTKRILEFGVDHGYVRAPVPDLSGGHAPILTEIPVAWAHDAAFCGDSRLCPDQRTNL